MAVDGKKGACGILSHTKEGAQEDKKLGFGVCSLLCVSKAGKRRQQLGVQGSSVRWRMYLGTPADGDGDDVLA